ncbi:uncharacterized protein EDB91DRAFT_1079015 [Suillus paluster]|uniref:uncharacterized protein n=1 Tax=Suillus paluster TaxID=48578 RepID=UPI001B882AF5|nr:uncharacterized protein EDB91DRAFT_1079015 [Suillus paluster]KAG1748881.1 hypothetical protein EDB91DRAFT_1079015 [Suillus paluster]
MDIKVFDLMAPAAPSKKEIELRLLEENDALATWISMGLAIKEAQIALLIEVRRLGQRPTETQRLDITHQHNRVQGQIDGFTRSTLLHFGDGFNSDEDPEDLSCSILNDLDDGLDEFTKTLDTYPNTPELTVIPLPSNVGLDRLQHCLAEDLILLEMSLREGQANDALHNLRIHLQAKSQALKTRAWSQLKISTAVGDLNARGQRNGSLAWFWSLDIDLSGLSESWNDEFYRVHWLQAKALRDQWIEELTVVELEMDWTCNFFLCKAAQWDAHMRESSDSRLRGHACYAARQSRMYSLLAQDAQAAFQDLTMMPIYPEDE